MIADVTLAPVLSPMVKCLWPEHKLENLTRIVAEYMQDTESAVTTHIVDGKYIGAALCCLRHDYVEGCKSSPVGYLEGIYVEEPFRQQGYAKLLCRECELWKKHGCSEFASDCELTNDASLKFHFAIGFEEENRLICFRENI